MKRPLALVAATATLAAIGVAASSGSSPIRQAAPPTRVPIVTAFVKAMNSFEYANVRALFTRDGVLTTTANTHFSIYRDKLPVPGQRVDGAEFRRLIGAHQGMHDTMKTLGTPIEVGTNTVVFAFSFATGITGTAMFNLRNGKIVIGVLQASQYHIPFGGGY